MDKISIAIVDDHELLRLTLGDLLTTLGYKLQLSFGDGRDLIAALRSAKKIPDVCILDVNLPGRSGHLIAKDLKQQWPEMKIIAFSVNNEKAWKKAMLKAGADYYVTKDANPLDLHEAIQLVYNGQI